MTPLESAARAVCASYYSADYEADQIRSFVANEWIDWIPEARAVLMAVREPEYSNCQSAKCAADPDWLLNGEATGKVFTAMIDAILNEGAE